MDIVGKVELSLVDYHKMKDAADIAEDQRRRLVDISKQLEIFLSFMHGEEFFKKTIVEFNSQSSMCEIRIVDSRVKIEMKIQ